MCNPEGSHGSSAKGISCNGMKVALVHVTPMFLYLYYILAQLPFFVFTFFKCLLLLQVLSPGRKILFHFVEKYYTSVVRTLVAMQTLPCSKKDGRKAEEMRSIMAGFPKKLQKQIFQGPTVATNFSEWKYMLTLLGAR